MQSTQSVSRQMLLVTTLLAPLTAASLLPAVAAEPVGANASPVFATQLPKPAEPEPIGLV